ASVVPSGFPAYSRILHPARGMNGEEIRWADVAVKSGSTMHRLVQFHAINRPPVTISEVAVAPPEPGNLASDLLRVLCAALAKHTRAPDSFLLVLLMGWVRVATRPQGKHCGIETDWHVRTAAINRR